MASVSGSATVFARASFTKIDEQPNAASMAVLEREVWDNAACIENSTAGMYGHVGAFMTPRKYAQFTNNSVPPWTAPTNPGEYPVIGANETTKRYKIRLDAFTEARRVHNIFISGYRVIKAQILEAVNETYFASVLDANDTTMGTSPKKILRHLQRTYGKFTVQELDANRAKLQESWDGQGSIVVVFNRIKAIRDVARAGKMPISDNECTIALLNILESITDFKIAVQAQRIRKMHKWNWKETVSQFTLVDQRRINNTLAASGYHQMNAADGKPIAKKQTEAPRERKGPPTGKYIMAVSYCWSCGHCYDLKHNSQTCKNKLEGHMDGATGRNQMNGSQAVVWPKRFRSSEDAGDERPSKKAKKE
jgi:hypothetical protein